ncbi:MAG: hypothetical protein AB1340_00820 [Pseudomonadota bacterium]
MASSASPGSLSVIAMDLVVEAGRISVMQEDDRAFQAPADIRLVH